MKGAWKAKSHLETPYDTMYKRMLIDTIIILWYDMNYYL